MQSQMSDLKLSHFKLDAIFSEVKTGDYHASSQLNQGNIPLVSCKTEDHGVEGYFDVPLEKTYINCVTIACDGTPLTTFYHPYRFVAKDNVMIGIPRKDVKLTTILYAIAYLNKERWRYSYGRKSYANKIDKLIIPFPVSSDGKIDEDRIEEILQDKIMNRFLPSKNEIVETLPPSMQFSNIPITKIFELHTGDYHNASKLPDGDIPLVSCGERNNGVIRHCSVPTDKTYENTLTIAYNGQPLTTKYHPYKFAAKDDVAVCLPKKPLRFSTLIFLQFILNQERWRYSYGRKCFRQKLSQLEIYVPINEYGEMNEEAIEKIVSNTTYWNYLSQKFRGMDESYTA